MMQEKKQKQASLEVFILGLLQRGCAAAPAGPETTWNPLVVPNRMYISRRLILQTLANLSLEMHETWTGVVGNDQILAFVYIDVPTQDLEPQLRQRKFYGDYKLTEDEALESACLSALVYLQKAGIILVDDINFGELTQCETELAQCQCKLLAASTWADTFQELAGSLKIKLAAANQENKELIAASKEFNVRKEMFTPPPYNQLTETSSSQCKEQNEIDNNIIRKSFFQISSTINSTKDIAAAKEIIKDVDQPLN